MLAPKPLRIASCWFFNLILMSVIAGAIRAAEPPPNVIVILADDLGYGDLGCYGHSSIRTPHIDRLAADGVRLTDFYVTHPYCTPTRAALLTGRHPIRIGMTRVLWPHSEDGLDESETTLAELLRERGYATALFGKWHLGSRPAQFPTRHGFDEWFGMPWPNDQDDTHFLSRENQWNWGPLPLYRNAELVEKPARQETLTERYFAEATRFIGANKDRPFFVFLPTSMPHLWLAASERFRGKSRHGLYGDTIEEIDFHVGELMGTLDRLDRRRNTIVIFFSDNGPVTAHRQLAPDDPKGSAGGLKLGKGTTWEGGVRVPCVISWPAGIPAERMSAAPLVVMDLFTTIAGATGCTLPENVALDGRDLLPMLTGTETVPGRDLYFYSTETLQAVRSGNWKLRRATKGKPGSPNEAERADVPAWLTDLSIDAGETTNLADRFPEKVAELERSMEAWAKSLGAVPKPKT